MFTNTLFDNQTGKGQIRVGKVSYVKGKRIDPKIEGFAPIVSLTKSTKYGDISPYCLKTPDGRLMDGRKATAAQLR